MTQVSVHEDAAAAAKLAASARTLSKQMDASQEQMRQKEMEALQAFANDSGDENEVSQCAGAAHTSPLGTRWACSADSPLRREPELKMGTLDSISAILAQKKWARMPADDADDCIPSDPMPAEPGSSSDLADTRTWICQRSSFRPTRPHLQMSSCQKTKRTSPRLPTIPSYASSTIRARS